jgi:hypothetical protein
MVETTLIHDHKNKQLQVSRGKWSDVLPIWIVIGKTSMPESTMTTLNLPMCYIRTIYSTTFGFTKNCSWLFWKEWGSTIHSPMQERYHRQDCILFLLEVHCNYSHGCIWSCWWSRWWVYAHERVHVT